MRKASDAAFSLLRVRDDKESAWGFLYSTLDTAVAIIRIPRERMVGSGVASSLFHEVGHQAAALLDLVNSLRPVLQGLQHGSGGAPAAWQLWERWISEIVADFWSVARVGISSTIRIPCACRSTPAPGRAHRVRRSRRGWGIRPSSRSRCPS